MKLVSCNLKTFYASIISLMLFLHLLLYAQSYDGIIDTSLPVIVNL